MTSLSIINDIEIATPCPASWEQMLGDDKSRFCGQCEMNVYNFAGMTNDEIVDLIEETEGIFCGRLYRRADGTVLTADCPIGLAEQARRLAKKAAKRSLAMAGLMAVGLLGGTLGFFSEQTKAACDSIKPRINDWSQMQPAGEIEVPMGGITERENDDLQRNAFERKVLNVQEPQAKEPQVETLQGRIVGGGIHIPARKMGKIKARSNR